MYSTKVTNYPYICGCMEQNIPAIYAAPLQGFTEAAWRNAHEQTFGGVDAYYTPFIRLEKVKSVTKISGKYCLSKIQ